jgi:hypothetical protein
MNGFRRTRSGLFVLAALTALALPAVAAGDHGSGGGGGTPCADDGARGHLHADIADVRRAGDRHRPACCSAPRA